MTVAELFKVGDRVLVVDEKHPHHGESCEIVAHCWIVGLDWWVRTGLGREFAVTNQEVRCG
jgi:hypothetical protein